MQDPDAQYPRHQSQRAGRNDPYDDEFDDPGPQPASPVPRRRGRGGPVHQREAPVTPQLPPGYIQRALLVGLIAGFLAAIQWIVFVLANSALYHQAASYASKPNSLPLSIASAIVGIFCLTSFIDLLIYFIAGVVTGRVAVDRKMGFVTGFVASIVTQVLGYIIHQFPGYPDTINTGFGSGGPVGIGGGIVAAIVILLLLAIIGGLVGFLGAWVATRRHPFYTGYEA
jgi:hypothetical protein